MAFFILLVILSIVFVPKVYIAIMQIKSDRNLKTRQNNSIQNKIQCSTTENCIYSKIVGVTQDNRQQLISKLKKDDFVALVREPDNKYDCNAILCLHNGDCLGYINRELAHDLAQFIDEGKTACASVSEVTGGNGLTLGCNIKIELVE